MKIIAVNINVALSEGKDPYIATKRAWKLNERKFRKNLPEFVIGVANGKIHGHYRFENVNADSEYKRVNFTLHHCDEREIREIDTFTSDKNLRYFVIKHKWEIK